MSILQEVIKSIEEIELVRLNEELPIIAREVHKCKTELFKKLDHFYVEFKQDPETLPHLSSKLSEYRKRLEDLSNSCNQAIARENKSSPEYSDFQCHKDLIDTTFHVCSEANTCCYVHEKFLELALCNTDYEKSFKIINDLRSIIMNTQSETLNKYFTKHFLLMLTMFHSHVCRLLSEKYKFGVEKNSTISYIRSNRTIDIEKSLQLCLPHFKHIQQLDDLAYFLWEHVFRPSILYVVNITLSENGIKLKIFNKKTPHFENIFTVLHHVLGFLQEHFNICIDNVENITLLEYIGKRNENKIPHLINSHTFYNIKKNYKMAQALDRAIFLKAVEDLQKDLSNAKLITDDSLLRYAKDLKQGVSKKVHKKLFGQVQTLIAKRTHDLIKVGPDNEGDALGELPSMKISSAVQKLLQLVEGILVEKNKEIINLIGDIFHFYRTYSSQGSRHFVRTALDIGLLHNNYIYVAHELKNWNVQYSDKIGNENWPLLRDECILFQTAAEAIMEPFLLKQKKELETYLLDLVDDVPETMLENTIEKCIRSIEKLIMSWHDLLPQGVFHENIGVCLNVLCDSLIKFLLKLKNIEKNMKNAISSSFINVINLCRKCFTNPQTQEFGCLKFIEKWGEFKALNIILKSDLIEIEVNKYHIMLKKYFKAYDIIKLFTAIFEPSEKIEDILSEL